MMRDRVDALCKAVARGNAKRVRMLIESGVKINAQSRAFGNSYAALHVSAGSRVAGWDDPKGIVTVGIVHGEHVQLFFVRAQSASLVNHNGCLQLLIDAGADVNKKASCGYTPLYLAVKMNNIESVNALLEAGAAVETTGGDPLQKTALLLAIDINKVGLVRSLLKHGANVNAVDQFGNGALVYAKDPEIVKLLIDHGARVDYLNKVGGNAMTNAANHGNVEKMVLLAEAGADPADAYIERSKVTELDVARARDASRARLLALQDASLDEWRIIPASAPYVVKKMLEAEANHRAALAAAAAAESLCGTVIGQQRHAATVGNRERIKSAAYPWEAMGPQFLIIIAIRHSHAAKELVAGPREALEVARQNVRDALVEQEAIVRKMAVAD